MWTLRQVPDSTSSIYADFGQRVREVIWSGGGELENKRHGVPEFTLVPADFAEDPGGGIRPRFLSPLAGSLRSGAL